MTHDEGQNVHPPGQRLGTVRSKVPSASDDSGSRAEIGSHRHPRRLPFLLKQPAVFMRGMRRDSDEEQPMISSSDDESPRVQGKTIVLGVLGVTLFLGALYMCFPMKLGKS